jgi:hypothetical protein
MGDSPFIPFLLAEEGPARSSSEQLASATTAKAAKNKYFFIIAIIKKLYLSLFLFV